MLGLGFWEIVIIALIALIVVGPERLPEFAKSIAKFLNEMKRTASDFKTSFDDEKDIFKENIDQLQKFKNDVQAYPEKLVSNTKKSQETSGVVGLPTPEIPDHEVMTGQDSHQANLHDSIDSLNPGNDHPEKHSSSKGEEN